MTDASGLCNHMGMNSAYIIENYTRGIGWEACLSRNTQGTAIYPDRETAVANAIRLQRSAPMLRLRVVTPNGRIVWR